jgi:hypothetical protein
VSIWARTQLLLSKVKDLPFPLISDLTPLIDMGNFFLSGFSLQWPVFLSPVGGSFLKCKSNPNISYSDTVLARLPDACKIKSKIAG